MTIPHQDVLDGFAGRRTLGLLAVLAPGIGLEYGDVAIESSGVGAWLGAIEETAKSAVFNGNRHRLFLVRYIQHAIVDRRRLPCSWWPRAASPGVGVLVASRSPAPSRAAGALALVAATTCIRAPCTAAAGSAHGPSLRSVRRRSRGDRLPVGALRQIGQDLRLPAMLDRTGGFAGELGS